MRVLLTGATGFVGNELSARLSDAGYRVRAASRSTRPLPPAVAEAALVGDIDSTTDWTDALRGVDFVVHAAGMAHRTGRAASAPEPYLETNVNGTRRLAEAAAGSGVRRFVFLSSVKVNGEETRDRPFTPQEATRPEDPYGRSKWLAEQALMEVASRSGMEAVVVRPPLIYGPGVRANFLRLLRWVDAERLLPLGAVRNRRSLVSLWNLCDLLRHVLDHPDAAGRVWLVSDDEDLSTPDLLRRVGHAMGRRVRLVSVPVGLLQLAGGLLGMRAELQRLCGSLAVDIGETRSRLGWRPPLSADEGILRTVRWYISEGEARAN